MLAINTRLKQISAGGRRPTGSAFRDGFVVTVTVPTLALNSMLLPIEDDQIEWLLPDGGQPNDTADAFDPNETG